jgi:hypothetical protein
VLDGIFSAADLRSKKTHRGVNPFKVKKKFWGNRYAQNSSPELVFARHGLTQHNDIIKKNIAL